MANDVNGNDEDDFFDEKSDASAIKTRIVTKYFGFWANVMKGQAKKLAYVDLYAGPGVYKDGQPSTPVMILTDVALKPDVRDKLLTIFNDVNRDYTKQLESNIAAIPNIEKMEYAPAVITAEVDDTIAEAFDKIRLIPTFTFIDPFGYKGVTLKLLKAMAKGWGCDLILFFSYNRINAALTNPFFKDHIEALFGKDRADELREMCKAASPQERETLVLEAFTAALQEQGFEYVLPFQFQRPDMRRTSHHLIFVTKSPFAFGVMKDIMAKESSESVQGVPSFGYAQALSAEKTPLLFELERPLDDLEGLLLDEYAGSTMTMMEIFYEHNVGRRYVKANYKEVLSKLYESGKIAVDRAPKKKGTFADDIRVTFPPKEN